MNWREIQKKNNKLDGDLKKIMPDIEFQRLGNLQVYLRGSQLSISDQEIVRNDLLNMVYEGKKRQEALNDIIGTDDKKLMDDIIQSAGEKAGILGNKQSLLGAIGGFGYLMLIWSVPDMVKEAMRTSFQNWRSDITLGNVLIFVVILIGAIVIVNTISRGALNEGVNEDRKQKIAVGASIAAIIAVMVLSYTVPFLKSAILQCHPLVLTALGVCAIIIYKTGGDK
ncbi:MAG: hypothetical protein AB9844_07675 [Clostridiaceae bacterium]